MWKIAKSTYGYYEASESGQIRRVKKTSGAVAGRILKPEINSKGYKQIVVSINGYQRMVEVHVLVAEAFHGPRPCRNDIHHIDHDSLNNAASNLEYLTRSEHRAKQ